MRLIKNTGADRVLDDLLGRLQSGDHLAVATSDLSLFAFEHLQRQFSELSSVRLVTPSIPEFGLLGSDADRPARNRLESRAIARAFSRWLEATCDIRQVGSPSLPQALFSISGADGSVRAALSGACTLTTEGIGLTPGNRASLVQLADGPDEAELLAGWFSNLWQSLPDSPIAKLQLMKQLDAIAELRPPASLYMLILREVFHDRGGELDEDRIIKSATGIRETLVWKKLFRFQRDGVTGAIDKLDRFGGCIIADSVGLGKTFEALAIIKYHELRNDRVLVLCPKRLRDNWTLYKSNDRRNSLAADRFNYDVLNHTDLSRDRGMSGDIDLANVNWANYDLVVIDESHNFRNKMTPRQGGETRYDRLMRRIIQEGVQTRVLMLSATPVNNRLADLRNQIAFATAGVDTALFANGISSIDSTTRLAQKQFNRWLELEDSRRTPSKLIDMLGFDYFTLLDLLTIARSRRHIEKYYGTLETGRFPERLKPTNIKTDVDLSGEFQSIREINQEIRRLNLAAYAPLRYVLAHRRQYYDELYSTRLRRGEGFFRQVDREESLIHLLRVNVLKRMESAVTSFKLTVTRQLHDVEATLARIDGVSTEEIEEVSFDDDDFDMDDPAFESLVVGRKVKVLLRDVDRIKWRQDLIEDRNRLRALADAASQISASRDAKLAALRANIESKLERPINPNNRKVIVFTAFADTARYLYDELAPWAKEHHGIDSALVTGAGTNQATLAHLPRDLASILTAFAPRSKDRAEEFAADGEVDLLIATDCISEGQNLQDCDWLVNYDIHWNPVRIIQRFGRIDRIGSPNESIQLVNFWPNMELEEYINLEQRVSGRMVLLDVSATGEENLIEEQSGNQMNDLEYRRKQLLKLQDAVIDLEDLSSGVSIADLTLTDFRIDLAQYLKAYPDALRSAPLGACAVLTSHEGDIPPGVIFCMRAAGAAAEKLAEPGYPLAPHYLVHVSEDGAVVLPHTQVKQLLERLKRLCFGADISDPASGSRFERITHDGRSMEPIQRLLAAAVASVTGTSEERAVASLFSAGGTHGLQGEFAGVNDFEVVGYLVILSADATR